MRHRWGTVIEDRDPSAPVTVNIRSATAAGVRKAKAMVIRWAGRPYSDLNRIGDAVMDITA